jgi:hypothetical protein
MIIRIFLIGGRNEDGGDKCMAGQGTYTDQTPQPVLDQRPLPPNYITKGIEGAETLGVEIAEFWAL